MTTFMDDYLLPILQNDEVRPFLYQEFKDIKLWNSNQSGSSNYEYLFSVNDGYDINGKPLPPKENSLFNI